MLTAVKSLDAVECRIASALTVDRTREIAPAWTAFLEQNHNTISQIMRLDFKEFANVSKPISGYSNLISPV